MSWRSLKRVLLACCLVLSVSLQEGLTDSSTRSEPKEPEPIVLHAEDLTWTERPSGVKVAVLQVR